MTEFARTTIDDADLAKYDRLGEDWWDENGPMGTLHKFNPVRVGWICDLLGREIVARAPGHADKPLRGLRILEVGCGGGILCESLARLGADMVGVDPAPNNILIARRHAEANDLAIDYRCTTVETLAGGGDAFDAVLVMEVVEHVKDVTGFLSDAAALVRPGGLMIGATLNRTAKSYVLAILGAEYALRWVPRGTHDWRKFVTPTEFKAHMTRRGLGPIAETGVAFSPLRNRWHPTPDMGCNYMVAARKPDDAPRHQPAPLGSRARTDFDVNILP